MKAKKLAEFKTKTKSELLGEIQKLQKELLEVSVKIGKKEEKNVKKAGSIRKDIAQLMTLLNLKKKETK